MEYSASTGKVQETRNVQVIHQPPQSNQKTSGGVLAGSADAVPSALESAKDAMTQN
ncbi:hypothetical protein PTKIN_Ptkin08bG0115000 [Pterospermum kingtungense]